MEKLPQQQDMAPPVPTPAPTGSWRDDLQSGLLFYYLTSLIAVCGVGFGHDFLKTPAHALAKKGEVWDAFANWDGAWYKKILEEGYHYDPRRPSSVAFFPAFPLLGRCLSDLTGAPAEVALLTVAHLSLAGTFVLLAAYVRLRWGESDQNLAGYVLLAFGLWPTTCFCRMAYGESLFLLIVVLALYGLERRWPLAVLAVLCGLATATRPVGICLLVPLALHGWKTSSGWRQAAGRLWLVPFGSWGLIVFMLYQQIEFGDPYAFAQTQDNWRVQAPVSWPTKIWGLLTLEPVRSVFDPSSVCYWGRPPVEVNPLFSLHLANPIYWLFAVMLIAVGAWKRWLTEHEWSLGVCLLLLPYVLRSHEMCMAGMGRFTAVVLPIYLVLGQLLARFPAPLAAALLALSGFFLGIYSALFTAWYRIF